MRKFKELKSACDEGRMQLPQPEPVIYTFGNVSAIDRSAGVFAIKLSGAAYKHEERKYKKMPATGRFNN